MRLPMHAILCLAPCTANKLSSYFVSRCLCRSGSVSHSSLTSMFPSSDTPSVSKPREPLRVWTRQYIRLHICSDTSSFELSPGRRFCFEKLEVSKLVEKFSAIYEMRVFGTFFTTVRPPLVLCFFKLHFYPIYLLSLLRDIFYSDIPINNFKHSFRYLRAA